MAGKVISYTPTAKAFAYIESEPDALANLDQTAWFEGELEELKGGTLAYDAIASFWPNLCTRRLSRPKNGSALMKMPGVQEMPAAPVSKKQVLRKRCR